ncbi:ABC transporter substrate-binding protein [Elioraea sp. Yellowstone]|jgi:glycine betaine/proline transport system substrate-binding protein|uniref:ABC transporter substrate-binding protein n=1 Tax=Elioraea sp. Yellowstone TaxID=2592070 RepID=UPI00192A5364|nr:ABC transporter substrate-binding protein [Elioraea sp. Yellowstone]
MSKRMTWMAAGIFCLGAVLTIPNTAAAQASTCEIDRPVVFAGLDWDSNAFHTEVARFIARHGYGCASEVIPGSTIPLLNGMIRGDIDVTMEIWKVNVLEIWNPAVEAGQVKDLGVNFPDATQAWYVPRYLVEGDDAPAKGLKSVADLPRYAALFRDPEEPSKGRFYNCIAGWGCETINTKKLHAYGLTDSFTNFRPGTGAALAAAIDSHLLRRRPIVFYYWGPTWLLGKHADTIVQLEEPPYDPQVWAELEKVDDPAQAKRATAYPTVPVYVAVNGRFAAQAPKLVAFLSNYRTTNALVSEMLNHMQETDATAAEAAKHFLKTREDVWTGWVPPEVAARVKAAL